MPSGLKSSKKGLINIENNDNTCFLWCHIKHLNLVKKNPHGITKKDKEMLISLIMGELNILFQNKIIVKLKEKTIFALMCFVTKVD